MRILIVEDHGNTREGLHQLLLEAGHQVIEAGTFLDGMNSLKTGQADLLIADIRLGEFNGLQLIAGNPHPIPSIVVTGFHDAVIEADARALGAEYLVKPIDASALLTLVQTLTRDAATGPGPSGRQRRSG